jgi:hypothetical protein
MTRTLNRLLALSLALSAALAPAAAAQDVPTAGGATFVFGAPCDDPRAGTGSFAGQLSSSSGAPCAPFTRDQQNYLTPATAVGSSVDVNLYLANPAKLPVSKVQAWLAYDPEALTGSILSVDGAFPSVSAADTGFFPKEGYVKLSAMAGSSGAPDDEQILVATLRFRPLKAVDQSTIVSFFQLTGSGAKTMAMSGSAGSGTNILDAAQPSLVVRIAPAASSSSLSSAASSSSSARSSVSTSSPASSAASSSSVRSSSSSRSSSSLPSASSSSSVPPLPFGGNGSLRPMSSSSSLPAGASEFRRLQVQGVVIGTQNGNVLLGWQPLAGATGYHVYYSTVSGVYTQRRTLAAGATGDSITGLPDGDRYFFAVRGVDASGTESDYSREVAVVVGQPNTATSPLAGSVTGTGPTPVGMQQLTSPGNKTVAGKTGVDDMASVLIGIAAAVGMWCAFRRQLSASPVA